MSRFNTEMTLFNTERHDCQGVCAADEQRFATVQVRVSMNKKGQVWYLIVSFPDLCTLTYFY